MTDGPVDESPDGRDSDDAPKPGLSTVRSGAHLDRLAELEEERRHLLRSLKDLEREREAGDVDAADYDTLKAGYTVRAAAVLRQIEDGRRTLAPRRERDWKKILAVSVAVVAFGVAVGVALGSAFGDRGDGQELTGFDPSDDSRTLLASARAALGRGDFVNARQLFVQVDQAELDRESDSAEARAYVGWTTALIARQQADATGGVDPDQIRLSLLALNQAIDIDPTFADPYCFASIVEYNFNDDPVAALPYVEECESRDPPSDIEALITVFAEEIRTAADAA